MLEENLGKYLFKDAYFLGSLSLHKFHVLSSSMPSLLLASFVVGHCISKSEIPRTSGGFKYC